ncbi:hypothetical protein GOV12_03085 [Candidatus Pacearchaeota archaeon]|nr:hypothetical protein [Candidatus Pacearchaeota archaeon]
MKKIMKDKKRKKSRGDVKGSIMPNFTVKTVIYVIAFAICLSVILYLGFITIIKDTGCKDSIVIRHSINNGLLPVDKLAALTCTTKKLCLTQSRKNCEVFGKPSKEESIINKNLKADDNEKAKDQVLDAIVEEMIDCNGIMTKDDGEPYEFMPSGWTDTKKNYCLICTRIILDEDSKKNVDYVTYGELYKKLSDKKNREGRSYLGIIHPGWEDWRRAQDIYEALRVNQPDEMPERFEDWKIDLSSDRGIAIVAQATVEGHLEELIGLVSVGFGTVLTLTYIGAPIGITMIGAGAAGGLAFWYGTSNDKYKYSPPAVYNGDVDTLKALKCDSFEFSP